METIEATVPTVPRRVCRCCRPTAEEGTHQNLRRHNTTLKTTFLPSCQNKDKTSCEKQTFSNMQFLVGSLWLTQFRRIYIVYFWITQLLLEITRNTGQFFSLGLPLKVLGTESYIKVPHTFNFLGGPVKKSPWTNGRKVIREKTVTTANIHLSITLEHCTILSQHK